MYSCRYALVSSRFNVSVQSNYGENVPHPLETFQRLRKIIDIEYTNSIYMVKCTM